MAELLPDAFAPVSSLLPFRDVQLVAFDLDGTLLPQESVGMFRHLSRSLRRYGVQLVMATGRALNGVESLLGETVLPRGMIVLYNGSLVLERKSLAVVAHRTIPACAAQAVFDVANRDRVSGRLYYFRDTLRSRDELFGSREVVVGWPGTDEPLQPFEFNKLPVRRMLSRFEVPDEPATAILLDAGCMGDRLHRIRDKLADTPGISVTQSGSQFLEIRPLGSDKAVALAEVAGEFAIPRERVLAVGDNDNDAEMLAWAGLGVAVSQASALAIANANYICRRGTFSGVIEMLRILRDAKRFFQ